MRRTLTMILVVAFASVPLFGADADSLETGQRLMEKGDARGALRAFQRAGESPEALVGIAWAYNQLGKPDQAAEAARRAVSSACSVSSMSSKREPAVLSRAHYQLGLALLAPATLEQAEAEFRTALAVPGADPRALLGLSHVALVQNEPEVALSYARQYLAKDPVSEDSKDARWLLCRAKAQVPEDPSVPVDYSYLAGVPNNAKAQEIDRPAVNYRTARKARNSHIKVHATIDEEGCTRDVQVEGKVLQPIQTAVVATVEKWVFQPAWKDGKPVTSPYSTTLWLRTNRRSDTSAELSRPILFGLYRPTTSIY